MTTYYLNKYLCHRVS